MGSIRSVSTNGIKLKRVDGSIYYSNVEPLNPKAIISLEAKPSWTEDLLFSGRASIDVRKRIEGLIHMHWNFPDKALPTKPLVSQQVQSANNMAVGSQTVGSSGTASPFAALPHTENPKLVALLLQDLLHLSDAQKVSLNKFWKGLETFSIYQTAEVARSALQHLMGTLCTPQSVLFAMFLLFLAFIAQNPNTDSRDICPGKLWPKRENNEKNDKVWLPLPLFKYLLLVPGCVFTTEYIKKISDKWKISEHDINHVLGVVRNNWISFWFISGKILLKLATFSYFSIIFERLCYMYILDYSLHYFLIFLQGLGNTTLSLKNQSLLSLL